MNYKVSIIIPCYNQAQYLCEALQSVLEQTYSNWECLIVNDGSPDKTEEVAKLYTSKDRRFRYFYQENQGLSSARNFGISNSDGNILLPLDADDKISVDYVEKAIIVLRSDPSIKVVYCEAEKFGMENGFWKLEPFSLFNLSRMNVIFCSALFRRGDWEKVGGYDVNMKYGWEDWEFWIAILKNGGNVRKLDFIGFHYRVRENSMHKLISRDQYNFLFEYLSVKHADFFVRYFGSFHAMDQKIEKKEKEMATMMKSEKFVIDLFCGTFFGFSIFKKRIK